MEEGGALPPGLLRDIGFNGATAMKPWKSIETTMAFADIAELQWGHGDEAVEELEPTGQAVRTIDGFNGATAMKPWKSAGYGQR